MISRTLLLAVTLTLALTIIPAGELAPTDTAEASYCYWDLTVEGTVTAAECTAYQAKQCVKAVIHSEPCPL